MKINNIVVTMWFNRYNDIENIYEIFNKEITEDFPAINMNNLPSNYDPIIPRINAKSKTGYSTINMSNINLQLETKFTDEYNENFDSCIQYIEKRARKVYDILNNNSIKVLYCAALVNLNKDTQEPILDIKNNLLKLYTDSSNISELGMRIAMEIEEKFYKIIVVNNRKDFLMKKQIASGEKEIIMPLISLYDAEKENESIAISYELNDKLSFDKEKNYASNSENFERIFRILERDIKDNINEFLESGKIS